MPFLLHNHMAVEAANFLVVPCNILLAKFFFTNWSHFDIATSCIVDPTVVQALCNVPFVWITITTAQSLSAVTKLYALLPSGYLTSTCRCLLAKLFILANFLGKSYCSPIIPTCRWNKTCCNLISSSPAPRILALAKKLLISLFITLA